MPDSILPSSTVTLLTPRGRGAVATIHYHGTDCSVLDRLGLFRARNGKPIASQQMRRIIYGDWGAAPAEEVVLCRRDETSLDIHCHGGTAAVERILNDLQASGATLGEAWMQVSDQDGLLEKECLESLSHATTLRTTDILLDQSSGTLKRAIEALRRLASTDAASGNADHTALHTGLRGLLAWAEFGLHLTRNWDVVLTGRPNVGKSSLINALLGYQRAIVFDEPGTTRDVLTAETAFHGWPVQLADTAGLRETSETLESAGIARAREHLAHADCRIIVLDASEPPTADDWSLLKEWPDALVVANKADLPGVWGDALPASAIPVSSKTGSGVGPLSEAIIQRLVLQVPALGTAVPVTSRQVDLLEQARRALDAGEINACRAALDRM